MKKRINFLGIITILVIITFSMAACDNGTTSPLGGSETEPGLAVYSGKHSANNLTLTITEKKTGKAVYDPKIGDSYKMLVGDKLSSGSVVNIEKTETTIKFSLKPINGGVAFTVTINLSNNRITNVTGTVAFDSEGDAPWTGPGNVNNGTTSSGGGGGGGSSSGGGTPSSVAVTGVSLKSSTSLVVGGVPETLFAEITPSNATNKSVTWSSSNTSVATISEGGVVTAVSVGSTTITVMTADGYKTATCTVTVSNTSITVTGVSLNKTSTSIYLGAAESLTASITPFNATNQNVTWSSSNTFVATVLPDGTVTAVSTGSATITVKTVDGNKTAICIVTVTGSGGGNTGTDTSVPGNDLKGKLTWLKSNAQDNQTYLIIVDKNEELSSTSENASDYDFNRLAYGGKTVTIILRGNTMRTVSLKQNYSGNIFYIGSGVTLILENNITLVGTFYNTKLVHIGPGGRLEIKNNTVITIGGQENSAYFGYGMVYVSGGTLDMSGGSIKGNKNGQLGGGVYMSSGTFNMSGGTISGNKSTVPATSSGGGGGGGVYMEGGTFNMSGGSITGNNSESGSGRGGGGVRVGGGTFNMSGGSITGNNSESDSSTGGGGVLVAGLREEDGKPTFNMSGGYISDNTARNAGGGVFVGFGTFNMRGGTISGNTVTDPGDTWVTPFGKFGGAGVLVAGGSETFTMSDGSISNNHGDGVCALGGECFTMSGGSISGNTVGVIIVDATFKMSGGSISGNGTGVCMFTGTFDMLNGSISGSTRNGVYLYTAGTFNMRGGSISGNNESGVRVYGIASTFIMYDGSISGNNSYNGGGVYVGSTDTMGIFRKYGGTIYGKNEGANSNTAVGDNSGHAVYYITRVYPLLPPKFRDTTAGPEVYLDTGNTSSSEWNK